MPERLKIRPDQLAADTDLTIPNRVFRVCVWAEIGDLCASWPELIPPQKYEATICEHHKLLLRRSIDYGTTSYRSASTRGQISDPANGS